MCGNQADMPLLRSFGRLAGGFYKHVAPTALRLGSRTWRVFQQAVNVNPAIETADYADYAEVMNGSALTQWVSHRRMRGKNPRPSSSA